MENFEYGLQDEEEIPEMDEITGMQISFLDILSAQAFLKQSVAA